VNDLSDSTVNVVDLVSNVRQRHLKETILHHKELGFGRMLSAQQLEEIDRITASFLAGVLRHMTQCRLQGDPRTRFNSTGVTAKDTVTMQEDVVKCVTHVKTFVTKDGPRGY
jgi:hypothetical protein